ncbi:hypothetical protein ERJ75_000485700 [Trypanosoma vivax]|nr:hypothetical protein ERJ75_000852400 [Trypanosoma vivax]KAH8616379.1 hypothetical protein ERJ75_000485700 [Trypanosoma vivax]
MRSFTWLLLVLACFNFGHFITRCKTRHTDGFSGPLLKSVASDVICPLSAAFRDVERHLGRASVLGNSHCTKQLREKVLEQTRFYARGLSNMVEAFANQTRAKQQSYVVCLADGVTRKPIFDLGLAGLQSCLRTFKGYTNTYEEAVELVKRKVEKICSSRRCFGKVCAVERGRPAFGSPRNCPLTSKSRLLYMYGGDHTYARLFEIKPTSHEPLLLWIGGCERRPGGVQKLLEDMERLTRLQISGCPDMDDDEAEETAIEESNEVVADGQAPLSKEGDVDEAAASAGHGTSDDNSGPVRASETPVEGLTDDNIEAYDRLAESESHANEEPHPTPVASAISATKREEVETDAHMAKYASPSTEGDVNHDTTTERAESISTTATHVNQTQSHWRTHEFSSRVASQMVLFIYLFRFSFFFLKKIAFT